MKDEDRFSHKELPPPTFDPERGGESDRTAPPPTHAPETERRLSPPRHLRLLLVALVVVLLAALAGGYGVYRALSPTPRQPGSAFRQAPCPFALDASLVEGKNVTCGFLTVPEDHSQPQGPTIRLAVAVFKTPSAHPAPDPVLVLGGGPGAAVLETAGPTYNAGKLLPNRDLILFDQRGAGYSQPSLQCAMNETLRACHDREVASGINLNAYTTLQNAADVHDLIRALGYRQVNLDGVSYGTRLALTVMRLYPADLRSVVLNSVIPPSINSFTSEPQAAGRGFAVFFQRCATDPNCNATYPHLQAVFYQLIANLNAVPITFQATPPLTGIPVTVHFTGNDLVLWLREALYDTDLIPQLPAVIYQIRQQNYTLLSQIDGNLISMYDTRSLGMLYSMECSDDMAYTSQHAIETSVQGLPSPIRSALLDWSLSGYSACQLWGVKPVPAVQREPVTSSVLTLILQGEYDPVTPPANGMLAAQTLSRSYFFLFPGVGHGVSSPISTCPADIVKAFWENPTEKPDASCISSMPEPVFT